MTPACTWWNRPEEDNSSGKLESTHPSRTSIKSDQGFFGVESVMRVNADSLLIRAAATSTSGTLNDLTTDLIMANNNNNISEHHVLSTTPYTPHDSQPSLNTLILMPLLPLLPLPPAVYIAGDRGIWRVYYIVYVLTLQALSCPAGFT